MTTNESGIMVVLGYMPVDGEDPFLSAASEEEAREVLAALGFRDSEIEIDDPELGIWLVSLPTAICTVLRDDGYLDIREQITPGILAVLQAEWPD